MIRGSQVKIFFLLLYFYQSCLNLPQTSIDARFVLLFEMKGTYWLVNKPKIKQQVAFYLPIISKIQATCCIQHQKLYWLSGVIHVVLYKSIVQYKCETIEGTNQLYIRIEKFSCPTLFMYKRFTLNVFRLQGRISSFGLNQVLRTGKKRSQIDFKKCRYNITITK